MKHFMNWISKLCQPTTAAARRARSIRLGLEDLEVRMVPATLIYDGSADGSNVPFANANLSSPQNYVGDVAPVAGDDLVFPASALRSSAVNDFPSGTTFHSISIQGSGFTLSGNALTLTAGVTTSNTTGINTLSLPLTLGADQTFTSGVGGTNLLLSGATLDNGGHNLTFAGTGDFLFNGGSITGAGGLTKSGAGILFLQDSAPNSYAGPTMVTGGTLEPLAPAGNALPGGQLTIAAGGTVLLAGTNQIPSTAPITINGGSLNLNGYTQTVGPLTLQGGQVITGTGTLILNGDLTTLPAAAASTIKGKLDLGAAAVRNFNVGRGVSAHNALAADLDVSATIIGARQLVKQGSGILEVDGTNTYSGGTLVNQGTLLITSANALGAVGSATTVNYGSSLLLAPSSSVTFANYVLTLEGFGDQNLGSDGVGGSGALVGTSSSTGVTLTLPGKIILPDYGYAGIFETSKATLNLNGVVSGTSTQLDKDGPGEVVLNSSQGNTYSGYTDVDAGTLTVTRSTSLGVGGQASEVDVYATGVLQLKGNGLSFGQTLNFGSDGTAGKVPTLRSTGGSNTLTGPVYFTDVSPRIYTTSGTTLTISGTISDYFNPSSVTFGLANASGGNGTVLLSGANTYTAATIVSAGTLAISNADALGSPVGATNLGTTVSSGATLQLQGNVTTNPTEALKLSGNGVSSVGALTSSGVVNVTTNTFAGPITLAASASIGASNGTTLDVTGVIGGAATAALTKVGTGTVMLDGANAYYGATTVSAGALAIGNPAALGMTTNGTTVSSGASLQLVGGNVVFNPEPLFLYGAGFLGGTSIIHGGALDNLTGNNTFTGNVTLNADATVEAEYGSQLTLSALPGSATQTVNNLGHLLTVNAYGDVVTADSISGAGGLAKLGAGTLTLSGASLNTYGGMTMLMAGTLNLAKPAGISAVSGLGLMIMPGAILTGSGTISAPVINMGTINPVGTLTVQSGGVMNLGAITLRAGALAVQNGGVTSWGTIDLGSAGTLTAAGGLTIQSGGLLTGSGAINGNVTNAGTINLGGAGAAGALTVNGNFVQTAGGVLNVELGGTAGGASDQLAVSGQASLDGTLNVSLLPGYQPSIGDAFAVLKFASSVGGFAVANGLSLSNGEVLAMVSDPTDLTLLTIPA